MAIKTTSLGSAGSATSLIAVSGSTNATPIVITVAANSGLKSGDRLALAGITGNTAANGIWTLESVSATTFKLLGSVGNGAHGGTVRAGLVFDKTPLQANHSALFSSYGNCVGTLLLEAFGSYAEFAAGDNSLLGSQVAPVQSSAYSFVTNTNSSSASSSTVASSSIVMAATAESPKFEVKLPFILRSSLSAWTSGTFSGYVAA